MKASSLIEKIDNGERIYDDYGNYYYKDSRGSYQYVFFEDDDSGSPYSDEREIDRNELIQTLEELNENQWTKEDERMYHIIITDINYAQKNHSWSKLVPYEKKIEWFKSLRERLGYNIEEEIKKLEI